MDAKTAAAAGLKIVPPTSFVGDVPLAINNVTAKVIGESAARIHLLFPEGDIEVPGESPVLVLEGEMDLVLIGVDVLDEIQANPNKILRD